MACSRRWTGKMNNATMHPRNALSANDSQLSKLSDVNFHKLANNNGVNSTTPLTHPGQYECSWITAIRCERPLVAINVVNQMKAQYPTVLVAVSAIVVATTMATVLMAT